MNVSHGAPTVPRMDWDPWANVDSIHLCIRPLPDETGGAMYYRGEQGTLVVIDPRLEGPRRTEALAHELVHHERGGARHAGQCAAWHVVVAREEQAVDDEVARRLVPRALLVDLVRGRLALGEGTSPAEVADTFGVSGRIARRALALLYDETGGQV